MAINIIGLDRLLARLDNIAGNEAVMQGIQKGCLRVEASAKQNCPINTGLLRASIDHRLDAGSLSGTVYTNVKYAAPVEFGSIHGPAQSFMYPALQSNVDNISTDIMASVREAIRRL